MAKDKILNANILGVDVLIDATISLPLVPDSPTSWGLFRNKDQLPPQNSLFFDQELSCADRSYPAKIALKDWTADQIDFWCRVRGIKKSDRIAIYDKDGGYFYAPRVAFLFAMAGYDVSLIHGGYKALMHGNVTRVPFSMGEIEFYTPHPTGEATVIDYMKKYHLIFDFRAARDDFMFINQHGINADLIPEDNIFIPTDDLFNEGLSGKLLKPQDELREYFTDKVSLFDNVSNLKAVCACNFSIQASIGALALQRAGYRNIKILKGGWLPHITRFKP